MDMAKVEEILEKASGGDRIVMFFTEDASFEEVVFEADRLGRIWCAGF